jgi:hypothetical protein
VEYDDDNSGTITNSEREAYHRQRLIRWQLNLATTLF